ncbi:MAG: cytochrome c [Gammaproteobacteria bacterium]|nr:cytochrome c [Gammaproteobacteria bacterium]MDH5659618.1 cytochrome c [Gammaproteobacteria bacterium]
MRFKLNVVFLLFIFVPVFFSAVNAEDGTISKERSVELNNLLVQDCGSCHGMTMKGGLGPALTPDILKNKSREMVTLTISNGRPGTPMPPWNNILTQQEINWIVNTLYTGIKL